MRLVRCGGVLVVIALLLATACSSSGGTASSPTAAPQPTPSTGGGGATNPTAAPAPKSDPGVTADKIVLAASMATGGPFAPNIIPIQQAHEAYLKYINDQGGIQGRKFETSYDNDNANPQEALANAKKYADGADKIFAVTAFTSSTAVEPAYPILEEAKLPMIGAIVPEAFWDKNPKLLFGATISPADSGRVYAEFIATELNGKSKKVGLLSALGAASFVDETAGILDQLKKSGITPVANETYELTTQDYSGVVRKVKESGADIFYVGGSLRQVAAIVLEVKRQDWKPQFVVGRAGNDDLIKAAEGAIDGAYFAYLGLSVNETHPDVQLYKDALKKYFPNAQPNDLGVVGWAWAKVLVEGLKRCGNQLTRDCLVKQLEGLKDYDAGWGGQLTFSASDHRGQKTMIWYHVEGGKVVKKTGPFGFK